MSALKTKCQKQSLPSELKVYYVVLCAQRLDVIYNLLFRRTFIPDECLAKIQSALYTIEQLLKFLCVTGVVDNKDMAKIRQPFDLYLSGGDCFQLRKNFGK